MIVCWYVLLSVRCGDSSPENIAGEESAYSVARKRGTTQILHISAIKIHNCELRRDQIKRKCRVPQAHKTALPAHQGQPQCVSIGTFMDPDRGSQVDSNVVGRHR